MGDPIEEKIGKIIDKKLKGVSKVEPEKKNYCPTCGAPEDAPLIRRDLEIEKDRHQHDIEKLAAERDSVRQQYESTNTELANALKNLQYHIEHYPGGCQEGESCPTHQALHRIAQEAKKNITSDDLTVDMVGEFFKKRGILGVAKTESGGPYKPFGSIKM